MSNDINKMDFKQLRNEVQLLRDELAIMQRKYEDILYNLDTDNFSSQFVDGFNSKASKKELGTQISQTAEAIKTLASKSANLGEAIQIESLEDATDTEAIYVIKEYTTNDAGNQVVKSETYYYFNDLSKDWEVLSGDSIYTVFEQTAEGFALKGNVKIDGSTVITENLTLSGTVTWDMSNSPVRTRYSSDGVYWYERAFEDGDIYMQMSFDGGNEWSTPMKVVGTDGSSGSSASVTFTAVNNALGNLFKTWSGGTPTSITNAYIYSPSVKGGAFYGSVFYAGTGLGYSQMDEGGFSVYDDDGAAKVGIGYYSEDMNYPYVILGVGAGYSASGAGIALKLGSGLWFGESSVLAWGGEYPGGGNAVSDISSYCPNATGIFIDFENDKIYKYLKGVPTEI